ncbi:CG32087 [Drosophila busckii]|uniref:CG32087 n=1 Tax=Drosophila busckii TaxID=30019 RepID=A0A0M4EH35_DROBS|nr:vacuole membrane protein 1 [Drosophila busckii]ALC43840.1 CG32087 [Drosophila busckii]
MPSADAVQSDAGKSLVLWQQPWQTLKFSSLEAFTLMQHYCKILLDQRILGVLLLMSIVYNLPGPHADLMELGRKIFVFVIYWLGLGVLSSVGFGTGVHTFLLYLGPHSAAVTLAAYECQTLDFPEPPYPDEKICPNEPYMPQVPSVWSILAKVRVETLIWGVGTALGELPTYFMAKTTRLSNSCPNKNVQSAESRLMKRGKLLLERMVLRVGFFGILLCASIPNPFFDLTGVACGHFLVPFWKFFIATLIGKALIKSSLQQLIVVLVFSEHLVNLLVELTGQVPWMGASLQKSMQQLLTSSRQRMHHQQEQNSFNILALIALMFELIALMIVCYFMVSLVNALAQKHARRLQQQQSLEVETQAGDKKLVQET